MYIKNALEIVEENTHFRHEMVTGTHAQIVTMSIPPSEEIGKETHDTTDQIFLFVEGEGEVDIDGTIQRVQEEDIVYIKAGSSHNVKNIGDEDLKILTIYAPPVHPEGTIQIIKQ